MTSIITPVYNSQKYIRKCINSVLGQTHIDWEHILVDDCSTDKSHDIIMEFVKSDSRIKYLRLNKNVGAGQARNRGINCARGRYIAFLDSDDFWHKNKLQKQLDFLHSTKASMVFCKYYLFNDNLQKVTHIINSPKSVDFHTMQKNDYVGFLTLLIDTQQTGKPLMPSIRKRQDWAYKLILLRNGNKAYGLPESLAYYRIRKDSLSSNKIKLFRYNFDVFRKILGYSCFKSMVKMAVFLICHFHFKVTSRKKV